MRLVLVQFRFWYQHVLCSWALWLKKLNDSVTLDSKTTTNFLHWLSKNGSKINDKPMSSARYNQIIGAISYQLLLGCIRGLVCPSVCLSVSNSKTKLQKIQNWCESSRGQV